MKRPTKREILKLARDSLFWFNRDGSPCDGFRFQRQRQKLALAVGFRQWHKRRFKYRGLSKKVW